MTGSFFNPRSPSEQVAATIGLTAGDEGEFDPVGDGTLKLRRARADHAKRPATYSGARPSWAKYESWST